MNKQGPGSPPGPDVIDGSGRDYMVYLTLNMNSRGGR
jgi:hypothetical protein